MEETIPKLRRVRRLDCIRLDRNDKTYFTDEGYLVDHPILTSVGIFEYTNPDGSIRRELRLPEHVFNSESLKSYKGKPIIITHDAGVVNKGNVDDEQIGTILSEGYQDGDDVRGEIIIHNTDAMKDCGLKELSLGYSLDLIEEPGTWKGQKYDAIQTNIIINHLALVSSARAGEQARLNIDGSDEPTLKGGKRMAKYEDLSPEELDKAVEMYMASKHQDSADETAEDCNFAKDEDSVTDEPLTEDEDDVEIEEKEINDDGDNEDVVEDEEDDVTKGASPEDIVEKVKARKDNRDSEDEPADVDKAKEVIAQQDADIDTLIATIEKVLADLKARTDCGTKCDSDEDVVEEENTDSSEDESKSLNMDAADKIFRQRLSICRIGDKLRMDGLEDKSIKDGKKAIINKVYPDMRLDGKSVPYIDAMYDLAVNEVNKRKDVNYQRKQMSSKRRADSAETVTSAYTARQRMIEREGGNA